MAACTWARYFRNETSEVDELRDFFNAAGLTQLLEIVKNCMLA